MSPTYHQQPTLQNARIRTAQDALHVFFAVARNVLTLLTRRLDADERKAIRSGNVYIWEDRSASTVDNGGITMERWYGFGASLALGLYLISPFFSKDRRHVMGAIAHTRGSSIFSDPLKMSFIMLHRSSYSIIKETQLKSVSLVAEGKITLPLCTLILDINSFLGE
jgi:hypothetical protein